MKCSPAVDGASNAQVMQKHAELRKVGGKHPTRRGLYVQKYQHSIINGRRKRPSPFPPPAAPHRTIPPAASDTEAQRPSDVQVLQQGLGSQEGNPCSWAFKMPGVCGGAGAFMRRGGGRGLASADAEHLISAQLQV